MSYLQACNHFFSLLPYFLSIFLIFFSFLFFLEMKRDREVGMNLIGFALSFFKFWRENQHGKLYLTSNVTFDSGNNLLVITRKQKKMNIEIKTKNDIRFFVKLHYQDDLQSLVSGQSGDQHPGHSGHVFDIHGVR